VIRKELPKIVQPVVHTSSGLVAMAARGAATQPVDPPLNTNPEMSQFDYTALSLASRARFSFRHTSSTGCETGWGRWDATPGILYDSTTLTPIVSGCWACKHDGVWNSSGAT